MLNVQWFYSDAQEQQQGPLTFDQVQQMAANGQIQPNTLIRNENLPGWTAASAVPGVFNPAPQPGQSPYSSPAVRQVAATGGPYPIPHVKKTSFTHWLTSYLASLILIGQPSSRRHRVFPTTPKKTVRWPKPKLSRKFAKPRKRSIERPRNCPRIFRRVTPQEWSPFSSGGQFLFSP